MKECNKQNSEHSKSSSISYYSTPRVVTGSFDKTVKVWSPDGSLVHTLKGFLSTVTGICYVPRNKTIWAAGGTSYAYLFDPKSGENVGSVYVLTKVLYAIMKDLHVEIGINFWCSS